MTQDPNELIKVAHRKAFISFALDKTGVPLDQYSPGALIDMALEIASAQGMSDGWIIKMLRDYANFIELHKTPIKGKPQ